MPVKAKISLAIITAIILCIVTYNAAASLPPSDAAPSDLQPTNGAGTSAPTAKNQAARNYPLEQKGKRSH